MYTAPKREEPLNCYNAFALALAEIPKNVTSYRLERNADALNEVVKAIHALGQKKLINLAHSYDESRIALAFYAGDGLVVKVIPQNYLGPSDVIMHLPAISETTATGESNDNQDTFLIKTYPWVPPGEVTAKDIQEMRQRLSKIGLFFNAGDDRARNIHRLPNAEQTLIGIDSAMYEWEKGAKDVDDTLRNAWHKFIHKLYPIYDHGSIKPQSAATNFNFVSIHDPAAENLQFLMPGEAAQAEPEAEVTERPKWPFLSMFGLE